MNEPVPKAKRFRVGWWTPVGVVLAAAGAAVLLWLQPDAAPIVVDRVRITDSASLDNPGGATESALERLKRTFGKPDYYLHVVADAGEQDTAVRYDTPIGNGLTFELPQPVPLPSLREVRVMHEGLLGSPIIDRVDVNATEHRGQLFTFHMLGQATGSPPPRWPPVVGWSLVGVGCLLLLSTAARFVWQQVV